MGETVGLEMFKETHEFYRKYGYEARLEDLTDGSIEFLRSLEDRLTRGYHMIIGSDEIRKEKKKLGIKSGAKNKWKCMVNTSTFAAKTLPYFPKKLGKLLRNSSGSFYDCVDDELVNYIGEYWDMGGGSGTSRKKRVESINKCSGRGGDTSRGYLLFPWEKIPTYFNPKLINEVGKEDFLGGRIEMKALERMCKDRSYLIKYYPNFAAFEFHKKYELSSKNVRFIPVHQINIPERWELYI